MPPARMMPMGAAASSVLWRAHKRGREDHLLLSPPVSKREREWEATSSSYPYPPTPVFPAAVGGAGAASMVPTRGRRFMPMPEGLLAGCEERLRRLSLVAGSPAAAAASPWPPAPSSDATRRAVPVERDLISKLQFPKVIKPRPARPLWTTICIDSSNIAVGGGVAYPETVSVSNKTAREVETELELPGALPSVVSGHHNNRVHLVNDAYKAMVGQPVCPWLDSLPGAGASRRINGIVALDVRTFGPAPCLPNAGSDAFPCTARITWEHGGGSAMASLTVPCTVEHLIGRSGDYRYVWRFDSSRASIMYCIT
ncbi:unnamed protein product [Miscanthus lutarioriparius]|uniref:Uncharacterized protein n=1 Tax=Miscanthus lutarioriparius TaxID=422564 RepID=A0A811MFY5_9POAL|nr:unnamed protein product [Miscanthus lutarioriparius]